MCVYCCCLLFSFFLSSRRIRRKHLAKLAHLSTPAPVLLQLLLLLLLQLIAVPALAATMPSSNLPQVKILFAGSSGLLGNIVIDRLRALASDNVANVDVYSLVRSPPSSSDASPSSENFRLRQFQWDGLSPPSALPEPASITHVVNFCGENISGDDESLRNKIGLRIWESPGKKNRILSSRIGPTTGLKEWIDSNCRDVDYIVASGVGVYGCDYFEGAIGKEKEGEDKPDFDDEGDKRSTSMAPLPLFHFCSFFDLLTRAFPASDSLFSFAHIFLLSPPQKDSSTK